MPEKQKHVKQMVLGNWITMCKKMKLGTYLSSCQITNYKTGLGPEPLKVLEENIGSIHYVMWTKGLHDCKHIWLGIVANN